MIINRVFMSISVTLQRLENLFMLSWCNVLRTIFFTSNCLLSHITIVQTMDSGERGMNSVAMAIINPWGEYLLSRGLNQRPPVLKFCTLPTELWGSIKS